MNVRISQPTLAQLCREAAKHAATKTPSPLLTGIRLEAFSDEEGEWVLAACTDLSVGIRIWGKATITDPGIVVVDAAAFTAFVASLDSLAVIDLVATEKHLKATARSVTATFSRMPEGDFPDPPMDEAVTMFTMNGPEFGALLQSTARFAR